ARREDAVDEEALAELLDRLLRVDGLEQLLEAAEIALVGLHGVGEIRKPHAGPRGREVDIILGRHLDQPGLRRNRVEIAPLLFARRRFRVGDLNADRPQDADVARLAADARELLVERLAVLLHARERAPRRELQLRVGRGERHAGAGQAGLDDYR